MKRIFSWDERQIGDVFLYAGSAELSQLIIAAEKAIAPATVQNLWYPSHAGILGPNDACVTEAWLDLHESSAAAVHPLGKYDGQFAAGAMQLWRPRAAFDEVSHALDLVISILGPKSYGIGALVGFEWVVAEKLLLGATVDNPIKHATVCSMTALVYLRYLPQEAWSLTVDERNCTPDVLRRNFEAQAA